MMNSLYRKAWWIVAGLAGLLTLLVIFSSRVGRMELRLNGAAPKETVTVSANGPLALSFSEPVQADSLEKAFQLDPPVRGRFAWTGEDAQSVAFWPEKPLTPGQQYMLRILPGLVTEQGTALREVTAWPVEVRSPELLYLAPIGAPELWQVGADGQNPRQRTTTGGKVYDFSVAFDGSRILFSATNEQGGLDVWELLRGADQPALLLPCGTDWCFEAAYSPDLRKIAYSRRAFSGLKGSAPGTPRLWLYDPAAKSTDALLADPALGGAAAAWSPDGRYLAFTDPLSAVVRVVDFMDKRDFSVPGGADSRVAWARSGGSFLMTRPASSEEFPYVLIYQVDPATRQARQWMEEGLTQVDYSLPIPSPDGEWLAVSRRQVGDGSGKQLWITRADGSQPQALSSDPLANFAAYQWDPTGNRLAFQRLALSSSSSLPQVIVWGRKDNRQTVIAENAFQPRWLP